MLILVLICFWFNIATTVHGFQCGNRYRSSRTTMMSSSNYSALSFIPDFFRGNNNNSNKQQRAELLKAELLRQTSGTGNGIYASESEQKEITSIVQALEKLNTSVPKISSSPKLNGNWRLIYTTNEGSSAGKLGPWIGRVNQIIDIEGNTYENVVCLGPSLLVGRLKATWDTLSNNVWRVKFIDIELKLLNTVTLLKKPLQATGIWRMTYLDDSLRILYASGEGGKTNTPRENIYVLIREPS